MHKAIVAPAEGSIKSANEKIAAAREYAIDHAKRSHPDLRNGVDSIIKIAEGALDDRGLETKTKLIIIVGCARALEDIGNSNRGYLAVAENVRRAVTLVDDALNKAGLGCYPHATGALRSARLSTHTSRRFDEQGGLPKAGEEEREMLAAIRKYDDYCEEFGRVKGLLELTTVISWIEGEIGTLKYAATKKQIEERARNEIAAHHEIKARRLM